MQCCSFCQRTKKQVTTLVEGEYGGVICNRCVVRCLMRIKETKGKVVQLRKI